MTGRLAPLLVVVAAAAAGAVAGGLTDLHVYQYGGRAVLEQQPVYDGRDPVEDLPFTYPPFAAVLMAPLAPLPAWVAAAVWTAASVAALAGAVVVVRRALGRETGGVTLALLLLGALALEPVWQSLSFGQVNLLVMLAVLVDLLGPQRRRTGVLVGVAAGVKLTPLVFVVLLALVGRRAAAGRAAAVFAGTVLVGLVAVPGAASYWTDGLLEARRVGPPALAHNQSAYGALTRLLDQPPSTLLWVAVAGPLAAAVVAVAVACWRRGDRALAACLGAIATLVASPVSWSHHWVWAVPVALVLWQRSRPVALAWTAVFVARPVLWPPWGEGREYGWGAVEHLVGNGYLLAALAVTAWAAVRLRHPAPAPTAR